MIDLNLPKYDFKLRLERGIKQIFDPVRKKFVKLTNEEWVRQNFIQFLQHEKFYSMNLMGVEYNLKYNTMSKRADIVCFNKDRSVKLLVECKATHITLDQKVFDQIAIYNINFNAEFTSLSI